MTTLTLEQRQSLESESQRCLGGGTDTQKLDEFFDQLLRLAATFETVTIALLADGTLRVATRETALHDIRVPRAKPKLRMLCARLAARCAELTGREVSPYRDVVEFQYPNTQRNFQVRFENTTQTQSLAIEARATRECLPVQQSGNGHETQRDGSTHELV